MKQLKLIRVGLYPDNISELGYFAIFNYSIYIGHEPCNQVLVIRAGKDGMPLEIDWES